MSENEHEPDADLPGDEDDSEVIGNEPDADDGEADGELGTATDGGSV